MKKILLIIMLFHTSIALCEYDIAEWYLADTAIFNEEYWGDRGTPLPNHSIHSRFYNGKDIIPIYTKSTCYGKIGSLHLIALKQKKENIKVLGVSGETKNIELVFTDNMDEKVPSLVITWEHMTSYFQCNLYPTDENNKNSPLDAIPMDN